MRVPTWVFLAFFIFSAATSVIALRNNNQRMVELRSTVYEADKNSGDVAGALNNLRKYVYSHMNTDLSSSGNAIKPPVQLKYTYERLQASEQKKVDNSNAQVYTDAQNFCQAQDPNSFSGRTRVPCVQEYVSTHGAQVKSIPAALYQYDFISPVWSPDLAGFSLVFSVLFLLLFLASFTIDRLVGKRMSDI